MSLCVTRAVWEHSQAKGNHLLVLLALADHVFEERIDEDGAIAWPSQSTLAKRCNCTRSTVELALGALQASGEIQDTGERRHGKYRGTVVWEVLPFVDFTDLTDNRSHDRVSVMTETQPDLTDPPVDLTDSHVDLTDGSVTSKKESSKKSKKKHRSDSPSALSDAWAEEDFAPERDL